LRWLIIRNTAEFCRAQIRIIGIENSTKFSFEWRWTDTPELPFLDKHEYLKKINYPDPVIISAGCSEKLDLLVRYENDTSAYIWNNESYVNNWRTPKYILSKGLYRAIVTISTQNGISISKNVEIAVGDSIKDTNIKLI
jgi:hypothetical protein